MAARAPKQWPLTKAETITSFESWRQNLEYTLSLDPAFTKFMKPGATWGKKTAACPSRDFDDDSETVPPSIRLTAEQKAAQLDLMLGQIANFCPIVSRNSITKNSTSLAQIWHTIRLHFGFQSSGAHLLDFAAIRRETDERPEDLFQRLMAFTEDNLLRSDGGISHQGLLPLVDEDMSPTLENFVTLHWLTLLHPSLPALVKQRYGPELRNRTIASLKPEISQSIPSLMAELQSTEDAQVLRAAAATVAGISRPTFRDVTPAAGPPARRPAAASDRRRSERPARSCALCKAAGRPDSETHYLSRCRFLPEADRRFLSGIRLISGCDDEAADCTEDSAVCATPAASDSPPDHVSAAPSGPARRVQTQCSPYVPVFCHAHPIRVTLDTGAEVNLVRASVAQLTGARVCKTSQAAYQADGVSPLSVVGETTLLLSRGNHVLTLQALVVSDLDVDVLAGTPFMSANDVHVRPAEGTVSVGEDVVFCYRTPPQPAGVSATARRVQCLVRTPPETITLWPDDHVELEVPDAEPDSAVSVEPWQAAFPGDSTGGLWPQPAVTEVVSGRIRLCNTTDAPLHLRKNSHLCKVYSVSAPVACPAPPAPPPPAAVLTSPPAVGLVSIDPHGVLSDQMRAEFASTVTEYASVFDTAFPGYNGAVGPIHGVVNIGSVEPPQRKGRLPQYNRQRLSELQSQFDELESLGVFQKPEDLGITVEHVHPSFLVNKPGGGSRLVTDFTSVGRYCRPQPSLLPDVETTLRTIGSWRYLVVSDLTKAYFQVPLSRDSLKYCGVVTPYKGVRVYNRCAMGLPGSESALEELMCRVLGDLVQDGHVAKIADDLFCGGATPEEALLAWRRVLQALDRCDLRLSPSKTVICPRSVTLLGWVWTDGRLSASPHRISTLASCDLPRTVKHLRSFIGAYKVLGRVIRGVATLLSPLDAVCAGRESAETISWSDELRASFSRAQSALKEHRSVVLPRPSDQLWIVTDGSSKSHGVGATLYVTRGDRTLLAGFFCAKLRKHQLGWLPCEIEALGIATAVKHFAPYITQSASPVCVLTDSKPCVQAFEKLSRGEFSASPRVTTFLATISRFCLTVRHLAGTANLPSDFASRNAPACTESVCQVCTFVSRLEEAAVRQVTVNDVLSGSCRLPFTGRNSWLSSQQDCPSLRRAKAHLSQGTRPSRKQTDIRDVKRYLQVASVARDGLLVVRRDDPFSPVRECIIVPRGVVPGLLCALHLKFEHPTRHQLKLLFSRYFYALDLDAHLTALYDGCHACAALKRLPPPLVESSTTPASAVGVSYAADVMRYDRQLILVVRETVTSYTQTCVVSDERASTLESALLSLCVAFRAVDGPPVTVRADPAPGFVALSSSEALRQAGISLDIGRPHNPNKNPCAEHAIGELRGELKRISPGGGPVSPATLAIATSRLNSRLRSGGLSALERLLSRDQYSQCALSVSDRELIARQHASRLSNHPHDYVSKGRSHRRVPSSTISPGVLVYHAGDRDKSRPRPRYLVTSVDGDWCLVKKFTAGQLRSKRYRLRLDECYAVPPSLVSSIPDELSSDSDGDCPPPTPLPAPLAPAPVPVEISGGAGPDHTSPVPTPLSGRPRRNIRPPRRFNDYVVEFR